MERVVSANTVSPDDIQAGDTMMFVVKATVVRPGVYRLYHCWYDGIDIPQGVLLSPEQAEAVCEVIFPTLASVAEPDSL